MNNLPYFWEVEDEDRGDPFDCIAQVHRGPKIGFTLPDGKEVFMEGEWTIKMHPCRLPQLIDFDFLIILERLINYHIILIAGRAV